MTEFESLIPAWVWPLLDQIEDARIAAWERTDEGRSVMARAAAAEKERRS